MEKIKLYQLVSAFSSEDLKAAAKFLASPFHNTDPLAEKYFGHLRKFHPAMDSPLLKSETVFSYLFPNRKGFDEKKLRSLRYKLTQLLESFLAHHSLQSEQAVRHRLLVGALGRRDAFELFQKAVAGQIDLLEKSEERGLDYFKEMGWLQHELYFHPETLRFEANHPAIFSAIHHFEKYFCLAMLCYGAEMNARNRYLQEEWKPLFIGQALEQAALLAPGEKVIGLLLKLYNAQNHSLEELKTALEDCESQMGRFEYGMAWKVVLNMAIAQSNRTGDLASNKTLLGLYQKGIDKGLFSEQDAKNALRFINIAFTASLAGEFEWAKDFIEKGKEVLEEKDKENAALLCLSHWHYHRGRLTSDASDFDSALTLLNNIAHADEIIELRMRTLQLRIFFDNLSNAPDTFPLLTSLVKNFYSYVSRNTKLASNKVQEYQRFIKYFKILIQAKMQGQSAPPNLAKVMESLEKEKGIALKNWLMERVIELKQ